MEDNYLKEPAFTLRLSGEHFQSEIGCLGEQLVQIFTCIQHETSNLTWFAFDVFGSSNQPSEVLFPKPYSGILNTDELIKKVEKIVQFHHEAELEIRPFDTSYFEVYGMSKDIEAKIKSCIM